MCNFLSAIAMRNGDIIVDPHVDSHDILLQSYNIEETSIDNMCRVEFIPEKRLCDIDDYKLIVDEQRKPDWFEEKRELIERKLRAKIKLAIHDEKNIFCNDKLAILVNKTKCASNRSRIFAYDNTLVVSQGNCTIDAHDRSGIIAESMDNVRLLDVSHGKLFGNCIASTFDHSYVYCYYRSHVYAYGQSAVCLNDTSTAVAYDNTTIHIDGESNCFINNNAKVKMLSDNKGLCWFTIRSNNIGCKLETIEHDQLLIILQPTSAYYLAVKIIGEGEVTIPVIRNIIGQKTCQSQLSEMFTEK